METWGALLRDHSVTTVDVEPAGKLWRCATPGAPAMAVASPTQVVLALAALGGWELAAVLTPEELAEVTAATEAASGAGAPKP